jgi:hypothetical protein
MQYAGNLSGSTPYIVRYKVSATGLAAGVIVCAAPDGGSGEIIVTAATATANQMGSLLDAANARTGETLTYSTTQGAEEAAYSVIINPDQVLRALMVTAATGTSMTQDTIATASSNGLTWVGGTSVQSPDMDQGTVWYTSGANVGRSRKITSTGATVTGTVIVPFAANAVGDTILYAGISPGLQGITLTTSVQNARADIAVATGVNVTTIKMECNGSTDSYVHVVLTDHVFAQTT